MPQSLALSSAHLFLPWSTGAGRVAQLPLVLPCLPGDGAVIRNYSVWSRSARSNKHLDLLWTCCCSHPLQPSLITVLPHSLCRLSLWVKDNPCAMLWKPRDSQTRTWEWKARNGNLGMKVAVEGANGKRSNNSSAGFWLLQRVTERISQHQLHITVMKGL